MSILFSEVPSLLLVYSPVFQQIYRCNTFISNKVVTNNIISYIC